MKKIGTYIGICDFMSSVHVLEMLAFVKRFGNNIPKLMVGTMTSYKVLNNLETKWATVFPKPEELKNIFSISDSSLINCIHYADYDNTPHLANTLSDVVAHCGEYLNAIQLDMVWPDCDELMKFQKIHQLPIVLQVNQKSMNHCFDNPIQVAEKINTEYRGLISHVLLDCSMGKGIAIDTSLIEGYIEAIQSRVPGVDIAVAGGLGPGTVAPVRSLVKRYQVSMDAQSKLRTSGKAEDPIDWSRAKRYFEEAVVCY